MDKTDTIKRSEKTETDTDDQELKSFFLQEKPTDMIVILRRQGKSYASELSSKADTTYSHAVKVMNRMKDIGLVESEKKGRKKEYTLTEKGKKLSDNLIEMFDTVEGIEVETQEKDNKWSLDAIKS